MLQKLRDIAIAIFLALVILCIGIVGSAVFLYVLFGVVYLLMRLFSGNF